MLDVTSAESIKKAVADVTSRFIVNRAALKTQSQRVGHWVDRFREVRRAA